MSFPAYTGQFLKVSTLKSCHHRCFWGSAGANQVPHFASLSGLPGWTRGGRGHASGCIPASLSHSCCCWHHDWRYPRRIWGYLGCGSGAVYAGPREEHRDLTAAPLGWEAPRERAQALWSPALDSFLLSFSVPTISLSELRSLLASGRARLFDVRSREEAEAGTIPGALNIPGIGFLVLAE